MKILTMSKTNWHTLAMSSLVAGMLGLSGCGQNPETSASDEVAPEATTTTTESTDAIRIATEGAYPPFNMTTADGELVGYDIDIANALCAQMQEECVIVAQDWEGIIPGLMTEKYDAIIAGMEITPERLETVDFSDPYFETAMVWIAKDDGSFDTTNIKDKKLGGQRATTLGEYLTDNLDGVDGNSVNLYDTYDNAYLDLKSGRNDAILADKPTAAAWLKENPGYGVVGEPVGEPGHFAIAVRKGDPLKGKFDTALQEIQANGQFDEIENKYFGLE